MFSSHVTTYPMYIIFYVVDWKETTVLLKAEIMILVSLLSKAQWYFQMNYFQGVMASEDDTSSFVRALGASGINRS
jgi:hypothetical protein